MFLTWYHFWIWFFSTGLYLNSLWEKDNKPSNGTLHDIALKHSITFSPYQHTFQTPNIITSGKWLFICNKSSLIQVCKPLIFITCTPWIVHQLTMSMQDQLWSNLSLWDQGHRATKIWSHKIYIYMTLSYKNTRTK